MQRWLSLAAVLLTASAASADAIPVFSTGTGLAATVDPHYSLISSAEPNYPGPAAYVAAAIPDAYVPNDAVSKWISLSYNDSVYVDYSPGTYVYRTTFSLSGLNSKTASLSGKWAADNGATMLLNDVATGNTIPGGTASYASLTNFSITGGFVAGLNTLDFFVNNEGYAGTTQGTPTGLRVQIAGTAATPEPTSLAAMTASLAVVARRRRMRG